MFSTHCHHHLGVLRFLPHLNIENMNTAYIRNNTDLFRYLHKVTYNAQFSLSFSSGILKNSHTLSHKLFKPKGKQKNIYNFTFCEKKKICEMPKTNFIMNNSLSTTAVQHLFWEREPKGGYGSK
ncbi:unnamed protein product, partial [Meganyctiphanes norvegica]